MEKLIALLGALLAAAILSYFVIEIAKALI